MQIKAKKLSLAPKVAICLFFAFASISASAFLYGPSNLPIPYPEFSKSKPIEPISKNQSDFDYFKMEVEDYVRAAKEYVESANNDIKDIQDKQQEAIDNANRVIQDFNMWASSP